MCPGGQLYVVQMLCGFMEQLEVCGRYQLTDCARMGDVRRVAVGCEVQSGLADEGRCDFYVPDMAVGVGEEHDRREAVGGAAALTRAGDCRGARDCHRRGP